MLLDPHKWWLEVTKTLGVPEDPGLTATVQTRADWADHTAQNLPSSPTHTIRAMEHQSRSMLKVASDLRETARKLVMQAQMIEAALLPEQPARTARTKVVVIDPRTGKPFQSGKKRGRDAAPARSTQSGGQK